MFGVWVMAYNMLNDERLPDILLWKMGVTDTSQPSTHIDEAERKWQSFANISDHSECCQKVAEALSCFIETLVNPSTPLSGSLDIADLRERLGKWKQGYAIHFKNAGNMPESEVMKKMILVNLGIHDPPERHLLDLADQLKEAVREWLTLDHSGGRLDMLRECVRQGIAEWKSARGVVHEAVGTAWAQESVAQPQSSVTVSDSPKILIEAAPQDKFKVRISHDTRTLGVGGAPTGAETSVKMQPSAPDEPSPATEQAAPTIRSGGEDSAPRGKEKSPAAPQQEEEPGTIVPGPPSGASDAGTLVSTPRGKGGVPAPYPSSPPSAPAWKYLPLPDEPDGHAEYDVRSATAPDGRMILGARVRGKKHKHEGTHCDDWFEFAISGTWTVLAVADGGGSYKFSRVGACAACIGAVQYLAKTLSGCRLKPRERIAADILEDDSVRLACQALHDGMRAAWDSVKQSFDERANSWKHVKALPQVRNLSIKDLYSTLLVAIHTSIETAEGPRSLIFGCAAGDGMIAVIHRDGGSKLLMKPDSGEFSSEVEFFTDKTLTDASLASRTYPFAGGIGALMLMSDGVSDDYFPHERRMGELYADLALNGIIPFGNIRPEKILSDIKATKFPDLDAVSNIDFLVDCDRVMEKPERVKLASAKKYAEALGIDPHTLANRPGLLAAALMSPTKPMQGIPRVEDRLLTWLDSYQVRGSFDDRTLVVMAGGNAK